MKFRALLATYISLIMGPILFVTGFMEYRETQKLLTEGQIVPGEVQETKIVHGRRNSATYHLIVTYRPTENGTAYRKDFSVNRALYDTTTPGSEVPVRVLPGDPKVSMIGDSADSKTEKIAIGGGVFLFGLGAFGWRRRQAKKNRAVADELSRQIA